MACAQLQQTLPDIYQKNISLMFELVMEKDNFKVIRNFLKRYISSTWNSFWLLINGLSVHSFIW